MKKYFYLAMTVVLLGLAACGDDKVVEPEPPINNGDVNSGGQGSGGENDDDKITPEKLAQLVTVDASYNESTYVWSVTITPSSSLGSKYPGKTIKYAIMAGLKTDKADNSGKTYVVYGKGGGFVYATANGSSYSATVTSAEYYGTGIEGSDDLLEPTDEGAMLQYEKEALGLIERKNDYGSWTPAEENRYYDVLGEILGLYPGYYRNAHNILAVYVEIDGTRYNIKEKEGKLRLPWFLQ